MNRRLLLTGAVAAIAAPVILKSRPALAQASRALLTADMQFYASPMGAGSRDGLTPATAFPGLQYGIDFLRQWVDFGGHNVVLNAAGGLGVTYAESLKIYGAFVGQGAPESFTLRGDRSTPGNCLLSSMGDLALNALYGARVYIEGFAVESNVGCFSTARSSELNFDAVEFRSGGSFHCHVGPHASLRALGSYRMKGSAGRHADAARGQFQINGMNQDGITPTVVTIDGNLTIPITVSAIEAALVNINCQFAFTPGSSVVNGPGGARYNVASLSHINVSGAGPTYLPGDKPGVADASSLYG